MKMRSRQFAYLIYLILITLVVTAVSFSRFSTLVGGSNEAIVARPVLRYVPVSATLNGNPVSNVESGLTITGAMPGDVLVYRFDIRNYDGIYQNQALLRYKITVSFTPSSVNLPLTYSVEPSGSYAYAGDGFTYMGFDGPEAHSYTLTVTWPSAMDSSSYESRQQNIDIEIATEQADEMT